MSNLQKTLVQCGAKLNWITRPVSYAAHWDNCPVSLFFPSALSSVPYFSPSSSQERDFKNAEFIDAVFGTTTSLER